MSNLRLFHLFLFICSAIATKDVYDTLHDLTTDPKEKKDLSSDSSYQTVLDDLKSRLSYWQQNSKAPNVPSTSGQKKAQTTCGGVCPWIPSSKDSNNKKSSYRSKKPYGETQPSAAPHIVVVMIDNWGYNDAGWTSTSMNWATPVLKSIVDQGVTFSNYYTHPSSIPSRGALLTGRYSARLGLWDSSSKTAELSLDESTLAEELKKYGYETYMVGQWGLGYSSRDYTPLYRGFDHFYGHYSESIDPYTKQVNGLLDLYDNDKLVTDSTVLSNDVHLTIALQSKVDSFIENHAKNLPGVPMFLYYNMPGLNSVDGMYKSPEEYLSHCSTPSSSDLTDDLLEGAIYNYCGLKVMINEAFGNLTCSLQSNGIDDNLVMIVTSSSGGNIDYIPGVNEPYFGGEGTSSRGGVSVNSIFYSSSLPTAAMKTKYEGLVHVTDWYPTILNIASSKTWSEPINGYDIDGYDIYDVIANGFNGTRVEIVHAIDEDEASIQQGMMKYRRGIPSHLSTSPYIFKTDKNINGYQMTCLTPGFTSLGQNEFITVDDATYSLRYMFDLNTDPLEATNIYNTHKYATKQLDLERRAAYWQTKVVLPQVPTETSKHKTWKSCGGVCAWTTPDDEIQTIDTQQTYFNKDSPHIIFALVDDWGWNDFGGRSTWLNWTTPTIDQLASEGIILTNYYSSSTCVPSRGSLLTGRYSLRTGLWYGQEGAELPLSEVTMAQELKTAGYRTYMVGKWHLGSSTEYHYPTNRGFDSYFGYLSGFVDYWSKQYGTFNDLRDNNGLVTDSSYYNIDYHNGYLIQSKAEQAIQDHALNYPNQPMFLYYAMQLIHSVWSAPDIYLEKCGIPDIDLVGSEYLQYVYLNYCGLNAMLDEAIANLTCTLQQNNMMENTILFIVSDNGGEVTVANNNIPWRGSKGSYNRGGVSTTAIIHSQLIPETTRGSSYDGLVHVTDWLPTIMGLATGKQWTGSMVGAQLDGVDVWDAIMNNDPSPRTEIVHYADGYQGIVFQQNNLKYQAGSNAAEFASQLYSFSEDLAPENTYQLCENPSLMDSSLSMESTMISALFDYVYETIEYFTLGSLERSVISISTVILISITAIFMTAMVMMMFSTLFRLFVPIIETKQVKSFDMNERMLLLPKTRVLIPKEKEQDEIGVRVSNVSLPIEVQTNYQ